MMKEHNINIMRVLNFVIFLLAVADAAIVGSLCMTFDPRIVKIWRNTAEPNIVPFIRELIDIVISSLPNRMSRVVIFA